MLPDEVKAARLQLGMTQAELGDAMGLTGEHAAAVVRSWEKGRRNITGPAAMLLRFLLRYGPLDKSDNG